MLFHQLGQNLVLGPQLLFQSGHALLVALLRGVALTLEGGGTVFEELLQPVVEDAGLQLEFFTKGGNRNLVDQMPAQDRDLLFWSVVLAFLSHVSSPLCLA